MADDDLPDIDPREAARARRRDRDLSAAERELMKTGQAKVFKQVLDRQAKRADEPVVRGRRGARPEPPAGDR
jgi:hypothetical protein